MAIGADGLGLISYGRGLSLKVARCTDLACTSSTTSTVDTCPTGCQLYSSLAIGADGLGLISYTGFSVEHLRVAHCSIRPVLRPRSRRSAGRTTSRSRRAR